MPLTTINMKLTGKRIEELMSQSGLTVKKLQETLKELQESNETNDPISIQAIYKWQKGRSLPSIDNLVILSEIFHVPIDQIIIRNSTQEGIYRNGSDIAIKQIEYDGK